MQQAIAAVHIATHAATQAASHACTAATAAWERATLLAHAQRMAHEGNLTQLGSTGEKPHQRDPN